MNFLSLRECKDCRIPLEVNSGLLAECSPMATTTIHCTTSTNSNPSPASSQSDIFYWCQSRDEDMCDATQRCMQHLLTATVRKLGSCPEPGRCSVRYTGLVNVYMRWEMFLLFRLTQTFNRLSIIRKIFCQQNMQN